MAGVVAMVFLLSASASDSSYAASNKTIDVRLGNKIYPVGYYLSNGGSIDGIYADDTGESVTIVMAKPMSSTGQDSDKNYYLDLMLPRELYDELNFTEHGLAVFADGQDMAVNTESSTCSQIIAHIYSLPADTEEIEIVHDEILGSHTHAYPPKLELFKTINVGQDSNTRKFSVFLLTDAIGCDVSFSEQEKNIHIDIEGRDAQEVEARGGSDKGYLALSFPHDLLGGNYTILVDGKPVKFNESQYFTKNYTDIAVQSAEQDDFTPIKASHLEFNYPIDAKAIDIVGTTAAPEFGSISTLIAAVGVASVLLVFSRRAFGQKVK